MRTIRDFLNPLVAVVTLAIGVALVQSVAILRSFFTEPIAVARAAEPVGHGFGGGEVARTGFPAPEPRPGRPVLSCYDLNILPIWHELKRDREFIDRLGYSGETLSCSDMLEIKEADLNEDWRKEFLVTGKGFPLCSAVGNCGFWVFEVTNSRARILLASSDYKVVAGLDDPVQKSTTGGYSDLLLKYHFSASETGYTTYKFDGHAYTESRCMYEVPKYDREGEGAWELVTCEEFELQLGN